MISDYDTTTFALVVIVVVKNRWTSLATLAGCKRSRFLTNRRPSEALRNPCGRARKGLRALNWPFRGPSPQALYCCSWREVVPIGRIRNRLATMKPESAATRAGPGARMTEVDVFSP